MAAANAVRSPAFHICTSSMFRSPIFSRSLKSFTTRVSLWTIFLCLERGQHQLHPNCSYSHELAPRSREDGDAAHQLGDAGA